MTTNALSVYNLTPEEKLQLVEDLWDDLSGAPEQVPILDWQIKELERRKANLLSHPAPAADWEEIKQRVRQRYGR